jgi:hypothetical protein
MCPAIIEGTEEVVDPEIGDGLPVVQASPLGVWAVEPRRRFAHEGHVTFEAMEKNPKN